MSRPLTNLIACSSWRIDAGRSQAGRSTMRIWLFVAPALLGAFPPSLTTARADDAAVTAQLQQILDAYVKDRASIEGLSGAALQVDRGAGKPILAFYAGNDGLRRPPSRSAPTRRSTSAATPRNSPPRWSSSSKPLASSSSTTRLGAGCRNIRHGRTSPSARCSR